MHPDWARSLRDQCQTAGVAFFFKQWGCWVPASEVPEAAAVPSRRRFVPMDGKPIDDARLRKRLDTPGYWALMEPVSKHAGGNLLDGQTWQQFPEVPHAA